MKEQHVERIVKLFKENKSECGAIHNSGEIIAAFLEIPKELRSEVLKAVEKLV